MKKLTVLLLAALMLLCACTPASNPTKPAGTGGIDTSPDGTAPKEEAQIYLIKDGIALCEVVTGIKAGKSTISVAGDLKDALNKRFKGVKVGLSTDVTEKPGLNEILVGETKRPISTELYSKLDYNQIGLIIRDGKIAIGAGMEEYLDEACNWFRREYVSKAGIDYLAVPEELELIIDVDFSLPQAPEFDEDQAEDVVVVDLGDDTYRRVYYDTTADQFRAYLTLLESEGFTKLYDNQIGDNLYATYTDSSVDVHVYYLKNTEETKIIVGPAGPELPNDQLTDFPAGATNDVYMLSTVNFGLSMVIKMKDGRFIVIDGAQQSESVNLVEFLEANTPEGEKPVIAAWFFTHAHPDHTYAFWGLVSNGLTNRVEVERFIVNWPSDMVYTNYEPDCIAQTKNVRGAIEDFFSDSQEIKPHTGDHMVIGDIVVDIMSTQDDVSPNRINDFNDTTTVIRFTIDGQRLLVTGDMSVGDFAFNNSVYPDEELKCDIFQMPHHGGNFNQVYFTSVAPRLVLLPANEENGCLSVMGSATGRTLMETATAWYGSYKTWKITMPFEGDDPAVLAWNSADADE